MNKSIKYFIIIFVLAFGVNLIGRDKVKEENYEVYVDEISNSFAQEMKKEYGLVCIGGGGSMPNNVRSISVKLVDYHRATVDQARELEVKATERLLQMINSHEKIRPFLCEYPFKVRGAEVSIAFYKQGDDYYTDGSVAYMSQIKGHLYYRKVNPKTDDLEPLAEEPYEKALEIVQKGKII